MNVRITLVSLAMWLLTLPLTAAERPNVILILMDDMGWRDVGFMGNSFVETPHLDRLAKEGLVFTQAYASAPNCAPTRACLMSGQYTPRHGVYTVSDPRQGDGQPWQRLLPAVNQEQLDTGVVTIAENLQSVGYKTAFFGMWNLGRGRTGPVTPGGQGFETVVFPENIGFGKDAYFTDDGQYLTDRLTDEVLDFVDRSGSAPFFVYYADHATHAPYEPKPELLRKYESKLNDDDDRRNDAHLAATVEAVDQNIGRMIDHLKKRGLLENTLLIFTSDNGGSSRTTPPLNGSKGQLYEGGIRVPLLMWGAGISGSGRTSDTPVSSIDLYPTLTELCGAKAPNQTQDGVSLMPLLSDFGTLEPRPMFWHFPCYVGRATPCSSIRDGDFKLIQYFEDGRTELFDLKNDPSEQRDLSQSNPARAEQLLKTLQTWQKETQAAIPNKPNPAFDANAGRPRGQNGGGGGSGGGGGMKKGGGQKGKGRNQPGRKSE